MSLCKSHYGSWSPQKRLDTARKASWGQTVEELSYNDTVKQYGAP